MRLFPKLLILLALCAGLPLALLGGAALWRSRALRGELLGESAQTGRSSAAAGGAAILAQSCQLHRAVVERRAADLADFYEQGRRLVELELILARRALAEGPDPAAPPQYSDARLAELRRGAGFDRATLGKAPYTVYHLAPGADGPAARRELASLARLGEYDAFVHREDPWVKSLYFGDAAGFLVGYPGGEPFPAGYDPRTRPWYAKAADRKRETWSNIYLDKDGKPVITCAEPLLDGGRLVGVAAADVALSDYLDRLFDLQGLPATDAILVNASGNIRVAAAVQGPGRFTWRSWDWKGAPSVRTYLGGALAPAFDAAQRAESGAFVVDARGLPTSGVAGAADLLAFARRRSRTGAGGKYWFYLVRTPARRVLGPALTVSDRLESLQGALAAAIAGLTRAMALQLALVAALALAAALAAAWLGAAAVARPLAALSAVVRRIGKGELDARAEAAGADEVAEVGRAVNEMAKGLKEGLFVKNTFKRYLAASVVEHLIKNPESLKLGGEERELTVFFSDMHGFTAAAEKLEPQVLVGLLNEYLGAMTDSIFLQEGTLDKYEGDAVMAFWGAPVAQEDHARRACWAALDNRSRLRELCRDWERRGLPTFDIRIGINTGRMVVGNVGSQAHMGYTVLGDAVNTGARLEQANKLYGTSILVSEATRKEAGGAVETREVDTLALRGKKQALRVYELLGLAGQVTPERRRGYAAYEEGLAAYRAQRWVEAAAAFQGGLAVLGEDKASSVLLQRVLVFRQHPPPADWDGVFRVGEGAAA